MKLESTIKDIDFQPSLNISAVAEANKVSYFDLKEMKVCQEIQTEQKISTLAYHPDALLLATGHESGFL